MIQAGAAEVTCTRKESHVLRFIIENSFGAIAIVDPDGTIRELNPCFETFFAYGRSEMIGRKFLELVYPDDRSSSWRAFLDLVERKRRARQLHARFVDKDGSRRFAEMRGSDCIGCPPIDGILVCWHEISGFKGPESELGKSERRYRALLNHSGDAIFVHDLRGRFLDVNQAACERLGYSREELLRMTPVDIDQPEFAVLVPKRMKDIKEKGHLFVETAHVAKDGRVIPAEISARFMDYAGKPAIISIARDITERKEMERLNEAQRDLASELGAISSPDEAFSHCLDVALELSGMDAGCIFLMEDESGPGRMVCCRGTPEEAAHVLDYGSDSPSARLVRNGQCFYGGARDLGEAVGRTPMCKDIRAVAIVPIIHQGKAKAYMKLVSHTLEEVPVSGRRFLELVYAQMGNVVARLKAEREMRESEARFRSLVEQADAAIVLADPDGRITFVNRAVCRTLGNREEDMVGQSYRLFIHPEDLAMIEKQAMLLLDDPGLELQLEFRALCKDGRVIDCLTRPNAKSLDGEIIGYSAIIQV